MSKVRVISFSSLKRLLRERTTKITGH